MNRFTTFEDAPLRARIGRLKREERDLQERVVKRISGVESEGGWLRSDPLYQRLSSVHAGVRAALRKAEEELLRRASAPSLHRVAPSAVKAERIWNARLLGHGIIRLARLWKQRFSGKPAYQS